MTNIPEQDKCMTKYKKYKKLVQIREDPVVLIRGHLSRGKPLTKEGWGLPCSAVQGKESSVC